MRHSSDFKNSVPATGSVIEVVPGILWARLALPFALNHVNVYMLDDGPGWTIFDTGIGNAATEAAWTQLLAGPLAGRPVTRVISSHHHPDHIGMAGWLTRRLDIPLYMIETEYLIALHYSMHREALEGPPFQRLYRRHGFSADEVTKLIGEGHGYQALITGVPDWFERLQPGKAIAIGGRSFEIFGGGGHSSQQVMLHCRADGVFLGADQVLPRITPNIAVAAIEPTGDPLARYLQSLAEIRAAVPDGTLVLPGHDWPFATLHARIDELVAHHHARCAIVVEQCSRQPMQVLDLVPHLFKRALDWHQMSFAFSETLAHVNYLVEAGRLRWIVSDGGWLADAA